MRRRNHGLDGAGEERGITITPLLRRAIERTSHQRIIDTPGHVDFTEVGVH